MSETRDPEDKAGNAGRKTITLNVKRTVEQGLVRQNFSHGRSKSVVVEKKRSKRPMSMQEAVASVPPETPAKPVVPEPPKPARDAFRKPRPELSQADKQQPRNVLRQLSAGEVDARARALTEARKREEIEKIERAEEEKRLAEEAKRQAALDAIRAEEEAKQAALAALEAKNNPPPVQPEAPAPVAEAPAAAKPAGERPRSATNVTGRRATTTTPKTGEAATETTARPPREDRETTSRAAAATEDDDGPARGRPGSPAALKKKPVERAPVKKVEDDRRGRQRLTITNALDESQRERSLASLRRQRERLKKQALGPEPRKKIIREVQLPEAITIQELANRMAERSVEIIKFLMKQGQMHKINDVIDADTAELVVAEFGHGVKRVSEADVEEGFIGTDDDTSELEGRAPVVTIMGHVDHGKTSLLDALRETNVVAGEAGGITQHIGAYQVVTPGGAPITFIDTPGHAAFTAMRSRGAKVTDIVILVVAADDGVMPQTVEAINHAKAAGVPMIVAINKMDKPDADPQRVRMELLQHEIVVETLGGDTLEVEVSAKTRANLDKLLEMIGLQAEVLELRANPNRLAEGVVIEAKLERGRGPVGTVLIQRGTLRVGQIVVAGRAWGRVRALINDKGEHIASAGPSVPVEVLGFDSAPEAGDQLAVVENEARARELTSYRTRKLRDLKAVGAGGRGSLEQMMSQLSQAGKKEFSLIIKGDVQGSVEAISAALEKLGTDEVAARIIHAGVGGITESDVSLASASNAAMVGFNVRANAQAKELAERGGIEIRYYNVIYDLVDDIKAAMSGLLSPTIRETFLGNAEILEVFNITKVGNIAGCRVTDGKVERGANVRLIRDNVVIHEGKLSTLKRFKDEVREVQAGQECGMGFENYHDLRKGDIIECFRSEEVKRSL
ncbi:MULTISPECIES: translation initiation factor IF-2 [Rhodomicrobium]|uniref:translation initiation factor IF-2 n=1 Tax=Rhodomicrobium TaxID=1068 RepID=UPI000B4ADDB3|nr:MULTISPECIES: translation initiation factor IF-2 [Rhodomicrobium]